MVPGAPRIKPVLVDCSLPGVNSHGHTAQKLPKTTAAQGTGGAPITIEDGMKEQARQSRGKRKALQLGSARGRKRPAPQHAEGLDQADGAEIQTRERQASTGFDFVNADPREVLTLWLRWSLANEGLGLPHAAALEFGAIAVMVGKFVVTGECGMIVSPQGVVKISLTGGGEWKDTTLTIPGDELTHVSYSPPAQIGTYANVGLIAMKTEPSGIIANDPAHRLYDPSDKGVAGFITVFLVKGNDIDEHQKSVEDFILGRRAGLSAETNLRGELPRLLRKHLAQHPKDADCARSRRTLRAGANDCAPAKLLFYYPPERSASDRIPITVVDEARTQAGEFLNDSLVDLYLRHMLTECFQTWEKSHSVPAKVNQDMDEKKVHIFTSHFFHKLTEGGGNCTSKDSYLKVQRWARNVDLFSKKFVFVPVVEDLHWSLACVCNLDKLKEATNEAQDTEDYDYGDRYNKDEERPCILLLDSLNMHHAGRIGRYLQRYVQMVWMERNSQKMVFDNNVLPLVSPRVPTQTNGSDCGVYVLRNTKEICQRWISVTTADVSDGLEKYFSPSLFSASDINDERRGLMDLLRRCKERHEEEELKQSTGQDSGERKGKATTNSTGTARSGSDSNQPDVEEVKSAAPVFVGQAIRIEASCSCSCHNDICCHHNLFCLVFDTL